MWPKCAPRWDASWPEDYPVEADIVVPVPDSGNYAALGFAQELNIPYEHAFVRNHYIGRTFLQPSQLIRDFDVRVKLNLIKEAVEGKRVVVVDDSIVRGTTARARVVNLREAGAKEVHMRVSCPPHRFACHYGIDFPDPEKLIANQMSMEEICEYLGVDSLGYLDVEGMVRATGKAGEQFLPRLFHRQLSAPGRSGARQIHHGKARRPRQSARRRKRSQLCSPISNSAICPDEEAYARAGVDVDLGNRLKRQIQRDSSGKRTGRKFSAKSAASAGSLRPNFSGMREPVLVASVDGVGTKLKIAFAHESARHRRRRSRQSLHQRHRGPRSAAAFFSRLHRRGETGAASLRANPARIYQGLPGRRLRA